MPLPRNRPGIRSFRDVTRRLHVDTMWHVVESLYGIARSYETQIPSVLRSLATESLHRLLRVVFASTASSSASTTTAIDTRILAFLVQKILAPSTAPHSTEREMLVALDLLHTILQASGGALLDAPSLLAYIQDDLCLGLLRICRSTTSDDDYSLNVRMASLPLWRLLWVHLRPALKHQWEVLVLGGLVHVIQAKPTNDASSGGGRGDDSVEHQWRLEVGQVLVDFFSDASYLVDMFVNYDCDADRANVVATILDTFFDAAGAMGADRPMLTASTEMTELSCLGIMNALQMLYRRAQHSPQEPWAPPSDVGPPDVLLARRQRKQLFQDAIATFNKKPSAGIQLLVQHDFLPSPLTPVALARFLRSLPRGMDKTVVGQVLGALGKAHAAPSGGSPRSKKANAPLHDTVEFHAQLRVAYVETFNFDGMPLVDALRTFLSAFRLPGEAQQIDRILETFATHVYAECRERDLFGCVDVAYLLSFSIIMLNTDLHNANIRPEKKMSVADFLKNNVNYGLNNQLAPLPEAYLATIYHAIANDQFRTSDNDNVFAPERWSDVQRSMDAATIVSMANHRQYDAQVLDAVADRLLESAPVLIHSSMRQVSDLSMQLVVLTGLVSSALHCTHLVHRVVHLLADASTLLDAIDVDETVAGATYSFLNDPVACAATEGLLEVWTHCAFEFRDGAWSRFNSVVCRLREFHLVPRSLLRHRPTYRSSDEAAAFVAATRAQAHAKRASIKKAAAASSGYFDSFVSRFFSDTATPSPISSLDHHASGPTMNFQFRIDDLLLDDADNDEATTTPAAVASTLQYEGLVPLWTRRLAPYYEHMHPLSDLSFVSFCHVAWTEIERVVLPPTKSKSIVPKLTPAGAVFLEQLVLQCVAQTSPALVVDRLWNHAHVLLTCLDPLIRGNLQVDGMAFENAVFLMDTLVTGLVQLDDSPRLCTLLQTHHHLLGPITQALLRGVCNMPAHMAQVEWVQHVSVQPVWIPEVVELLDKWMHTLVVDAGNVADDCDSNDNSPAAVHALTNVVFTWGIFPADAEVAVAGQALKYAVQLFHQPTTTRIDALTIVGGLLALRRHPNVDIRMNAIHTLKQCLLESTVVTKRLFTPDTWALVVRIGCQGERGVLVRSTDAAGTESPDQAGLVALALPPALVGTAPSHDESNTDAPVTTELGRMHVLAQVFLHHMDDLAGLSDLDLLWSELLQALVWHLALPTHHEETLQLMRNVVQVVHASFASQPWFQSSVGTIATQHPDLAAWTPQETHAVASVVVPPIAASD
ncbi:hypothetical protein, variant 1 [Aphanomyces invadans]|uniref:SEC7 domain-containing protein n=1 Tax=Aphanomyces invadans TaxID=157072 RepID=A0A024THC1_9STRA|nr:hypothetical protein, variant 1 [Aphanomyces invadans]ETV92752.1 hypothetical protein, variant 1 [Aphanomyces invadans]|eukprot:XP_008878522.1 hypothetical protein, variant 1 [Aphanomyces invadans]